MKDAKRRFIAGRDQSVLLPADLARITQQKIRYVKRKVKTSSLLDQKNQLVAKPQQSRHIKRMKNSILQPND